MARRNCGPPERNDTEVLGNCHLQRPRRAVTLIVTLPKFSYQTSLLELTVSSCNNVVSALGLEPRTS